VKVRYQGKGKPLPETPTTQGLANITVVVMNADTTVAAIPKGEHQGQLPLPDPARDDVEALHSDEKWKTEERDSHEERGRVV